MAEIIAGVDTAVGVNSNTPEMSTAVVSSSVNVNSCNFRPPHHIGLTHLYMFRKKRVTFGYERIQVQ